MLLFSTRSGRLMLFSLIAITFAFSSTVFPQSPASPQTAPSDATGSEVTSPDATTPEQSSAQAPEASSRVTPSEAATSPESRVVQAPQSNEGQTPSKKRSPVKIPGKKTLPLKLLTRPFSNIYEKPDAGSKSVVENVPTFSIFYAYSTPNEQPGWYEVGTDNRGTVRGWMKADDLIEWKQYLTMTFTNPAERDPTLFFSDKEKLTRMVANETRAAEVRAIRQSIDETRKDPQRPFPESFPVVAMEPPDFVDVHKGPYLMPILSSEEVNIDGKPSQVLEIASAVKGVRKDTTKGDDLASSVVDDSMVSDQLELMKKWKADIVFVIDATASMQPYINTTREVVKESAKAISDAGIDGIISFGLIAYRDNVQKIPGIEYTSKIFCNMEEGANLDTFNQKVGEVREAQVGSEGFDEDVWAGVSMALTAPELKCRPDASLIIVVIGDAGAHDYPDPMRTTDFVGSTLRSVADKHQPRSATILGFHLQTPEARKANDISKAATQFQTIVSRFGGEELYFPVVDGQPEAFRTQAQALVSVCSKLQQEAAKNGELAPHISSPIVAPATPPTPEEKIVRVVTGAIRAAQLEYLGSKRTEKGEVKVPRDLRAFVADRDLEDPAKRPMNKNLIITKNNIDELKKSLEGVLEAGYKAQVSGSDFFDELQSVMASSVRDPKMMHSGVALGKIGLMPEFIEGLPYKSEILNMTNEEWTGMSPDMQAEFLNKVKAKIALYQHFYNNRDQWIPLNEGDEPGDWVMYLSMDALP